jgi:hypothetical protein
MVIGLYADDSTDHPQQRMQTAGAVWGWPADIFEAERQWEQHLKTAGIEYFKASEAEGLRGQFDPAKLGMSLNSARAKADSTRRDLVDVIGRLPLTATAVSVILDDFKDVVSSNAKARYYYGTDSTILVYGLLIRATIELIQEQYPMQSKRDTIAFMFDEHKNFLRAEAAYLSLKRRDITCASMMGVVSHGDDKQHKPLQMADVIAHEARHKSMGSLSSSENDRHMYKVMDKSGVFSLIGVVGKEGMLRELDNYPDPPADGSSNEFRWILE